MAVAAVFADPFFYSKNFLQLIGFRYIDSNVYTSLAQTRVRKSIIMLHYGGSEVAPGPKCVSCASSSGVKCDTAACPLQANKIECRGDCGELCQNLVFSNNTFPDTLQIRSSDVYGFSLVTTAAIPAGLPILELIGKLEVGHVNAAHHFRYPIQRFAGSMGLYLNQEKEANESRFIAHSGDAPNCEIQDWVVGKELRFLIVAITDIAEETVLTRKYPQLV